MSGELRLVRRAPSQTSCILFVFSSVQVSPQYNDCIFLRSFGLRAYITFICALTCSLYSATLFSASIFASYLVETPFLSRWYLDIGMYLGRHADGTVRHRKFAVHVEQKCCSRSSISVNSLIMGSAFCSP